MRPARVLRQGTSTASSIGKASMSARNPMTGPLPTPRIVPTTPWPPIPVATSMPHAFSRSATTGRGARHVEAELGMGMQVAADGGQFGMEGRDRLEGGHGGAPGLRDPARGLPARLNRRPFQRKPGRRPETRMSLKWLGLIPWIALLVGMPIVNRVEPFVFGLPLPLAWSTVCTILSVLVLALIYRLDPANRTP